MRRMSLKRTAQLDLEWWIIHREPQAFESGRLQAALAALPAELYQLSPDRFMEHAQYRAQAMVLRDRLAEQKGVTEADWQRINQLLLQSWHSLWQAVNS